MSYLWGGRGPWFLTRYVRAPTYSAAAQAYFDAMAVQPTPARKKVINDLFVGLAFDGIWTKLDWLSLFASHDAQSARLNAKNPAAAFTAVNSPTFTTDRGYSGNGSSSYLNSGWDPATNAVQYAQNSCHLGVWFNTNGSNSGWLGGSLAARINPSNGASTFSLVGQSGSGTIITPVTSSTGFGAWDRSASTAGKVFKNGAEIGTFGTTSSALNTSDFFACAYNNAGTPVYSAASTRIAAMCWGAHLSDAEHLALYTRLNTYLTAIGAA